MNSQKTNEERLDFLRMYCRILESKFKIPGTNFHFGIDPILSLIPIVGSHAGLILGFIFILLAHRHGISGKVKILMVRNIFIDHLIGVIPILGNIGDFIYKSNERNLRLVEAHINEGKHQGSGLSLIFGFVIIFAVFVISSLVFLIWLVIKMMEMIPF